MKVRNVMTIMTVVVLFIGLGFAFVMYKNTFSSNTKFKEKEVYVHIPTNSTYAEAKQILQNYIKDYGKFETLASQFGYDQRVIEGRFLLTKGMNNYDIFQALRKNIPVKVTFNNQETIEKLAGRLAKQIEPDSVTLLKTFTDPEFLEEAGFNRENVLAMFLPNTFEFYWNTTAMKVRNTLHKEYLKFWTPERLAKAKALGLTPNEVAVLAAIVQKETAKEDERPRVAGAYLNRLKKDMLLQADPTVVYSKKLLSGNFDQVIKRVYLKDLVLNSPYNTYLFKGLPPGMISMPDVSSIDAVLNPEKHDYIYFCASVEKIGYHAFAKTIEEHNSNRQKYIDWLNTNNIQ